MPRMSSGKVAQDACETGDMCRKGTARETRPVERNEVAPEWLSTYLYFTGDLYGRECDRVLLDVVAPFVEGVERRGHRWFFIRYHEHGPHVRLRVLGPPTWLAHDVLPAIAQMAKTSSGIDRVTFVEYEPEIDRYGGSRGIDLAEELFHHSSCTALALLRKIRTSDRAAVLGKAVLAMVVLLHAFVGRRHEAARLAELYGTSYLRLQVPDPGLQARWQASFEQGFNRQVDRFPDYIESTWMALEAGTPLTDELDVYRDRMQEMAAALEGLRVAGRLLEMGPEERDESLVWRRIVTSYLHMMNNRLGVSIRQECYLAVLIHKVLGRVARKSA